VNRLRLQTQGHPRGVMPGTYSRGMLAVCGRALQGGRRNGAIRAGCGRPARAIAVEGGTRPAPRPGASGLDTTTAWGLVGLGLVGVICCAVPVFMRGWPWPRSR